MSNIQTILVCAFNKDAAQELRDRWDNKKIVNPSKLQQDVINALHNTNDNIITGAVAGSGKTSLLMALLQSIESKQLSQNQKTLEVTILNIHKIATQGGLLKAAIGDHSTFTGKRYDFKLGNYKEGILKEFHNELVEYTNSLDVECPNYWDTRSIVLKLIDNCRNELVNFYDHEQIEQLRIKHGLELNDENCKKRIFNFVGNILQSGIDELLGKDKAKKRPDFEDQIFMPVYVSKKYKLNHSFKFDLIIVDECQDLSKCQLELIKLCRHQNSRFLFVGDPRQAIYGFAGADTNSFNRIKENLNCTYYPLSVNYRCPKSVLQLAKKYCPEIEPCDNAPEGEIIKIKDSEVCLRVQPGEVVLCRLTAPLVKCAIQCIKLQKPAKIKGRDIAEQLTKRLKEIESIEGFAYIDFFDYCNKYYNAKTEKLIGKVGTENYIATLMDEKEALEACYSQFIMADSINELSREIDAIFEKEDSLITLQTIHKAKGSEAEIVYILHYDKMPFKFKKTTDEQLEQERNLTYVALTRCKFNANNQSPGKLYLCKDDSSENNNAE